MRLYLSGPMRGLPQFNRAAFDEAAAKLRAKGHEVFSPPEHSANLFGPQALDDADGDEARLGGDPLTISRTLFHGDLTQICLWADAVALLPGWQDSRGASAEAAVGRALPIIAKPVEEF